MKLNNKGMAISGILYSILVLFIVLVFGLLSLLASTKYSFDKFKHDLKEKLETLEFELVHEDYMLVTHSDLHITEQSIFNYFYPTEFSSIKTVRFMKGTTIPEGATKVTDVSKTKNNKIQSYLMPRGDGGYDLYIISEGLIYANYDSSLLFAEMPSVTDITLDNFDTSATIKMTEMFYDNKALTSVDVSKFNMTNVLYTQAMFYNCENLTYLDVSSWDLSSAVAMGMTFYNCASLRNLDVSNWNVSNVQDMHKLFDSCKSLEVLDVSRWDTSNLTDAHYLFGSDKYYEMALREIRGIENLNTSKVTTMYGMFFYCVNLTNLDLKRWNVSNVTNMNNMFKNCKGLTSLDLSNWNVGKVTNMSYMFDDASNITTLNLTGWDTKSVTNMTSMFSNMNNVTSIAGMSNFDTSKVTSFKSMFSGMNNCTTADLSNWVFNESADTSEMFENYDVDTLIVKDSAAANKVAQYLPNRTATSIGKVVINGEYSGVNLADLQALNWYVFDSSGNQI